MCGLQRRLAMDQIYLFWDRFLLHIHTTYKYPYFSTIFISWCVVYFLILWISVQIKFCNIGMLNKVSDCIYSHTWAYFWHQIECGLFSFFENFNILTKKIATVGKQRKNIQNLSFKNLNPLNFPKRYFTPYIFAIARDKDPGPQNLGL